jgi:meiotically up-regulated gene 157 (Mug157) protein
VAGLTIHLPTSRWDRYRLDRQHIEQVQYVIGSNVASEFLGVVSDVADQIEQVLNDAVVARIFRDAMVRTREEALVERDDGSVFALTGDIPAMWLRDSAAQMRPFVALADMHPSVPDLLVGLVRAQFAAILHDPYANAFNQDPTGAGHTADLTQMSPWVWERKYEVDSLCFPIQLAHQTWRVTGRTDHFGADFRAAANQILDTWRAEQDHATSPYVFERLDGPASDTLVDGGRGTPVGRTGMTWSGFRPSDDACRYHYNIPGNLFAVAALGMLGEIAVDVLDDPSLASRASTLAAEIQAGIDTWGIVDHPELGPIYAYEVDGLGGQLLLDDANMPGLLSLPLLSEVTQEDPVYRATRAFVLSSRNPTYYVGAAANGIGSEHTPEGFVWPIAMAVQGLTAGTTTEKVGVLRALRDTHAGTFRMHESFHVDDPATFTREWFSWADSMFCELALQLVGRPVPGPAVEAKIR